MVRVVVDAMGGDLGLETVIDGVVHLSLEDNDIQMILVGDADAITHALGERQHDPRKLQVVHADGVVAMSESAKDTLRDRPNCSIAVAMEVLARGDGDALVSAGHTGATILAASQHLEKLPGIRRAALAAVPVSYTHLTLPTICSV